MFPIYKHAKTTAVFVLLAFILSSCKVYPPVLKSLDKVKIERSGTTGFVIGTEAIINNPNRGRVRIKDLNLEVTINNKPVASIGKKTDILIKRNTDFSIPLSIEIKSIESVFSDFKSIFGMLKDMEAEVSLKGDIKLRAFCFLKYHFPVEYKQKVNLPKLK